MLARTLIEVTEQNGEKEFKYIFSVEPSDLFETKVRHSPNVTINNKRFENATLSTIVDAIRNGN